MTKGETDELDLWMVHFNQTSSVMDQANKNRLSEGIGNWRKQLASLILIDTHKHHIQLTENTAKHT